MDTIQAQCQKCGEITDCILDTNGKPICEDCELADIDENEEKDIFHLKIMNKKEVMTWKNEILKKFIYENKNKNELAKKKRTRKTN